MPYISAFLISYNMLMNIFNFLGANYKHICVDGLWACGYCAMFWLLTHWGQDKMDTISHTIHSNVPCSIKMFEFRIRFHWSLFLRFQLTISQHWFWWWLGADQATSHYLNQWWLVYRCIYTSLSLNELLIASWPCNCARGTIYDLFWIPVSVIICWGCSSSCVKIHFYVRCLIIWYFNTITCVKDYEILFWDVL